MSELINVSKISVGELQAAVDKIDAENASIFSEMVRFTNDGNVEAAFECAEQTRRNNSIKYLILDQLHGEIVDCFRANLNQH